MQVRAYKNKNSRSRASAVPVPKVNHSWKSREEIAVALELR